MSYIRGSTNPENLYVWGGCNGVNWHTGTKQWAIPADDFHIFMKQVKENDYEEGEYGDLRCSEQWILSGTENIVENPPSLKDMVIANSYEKIDRKIVLWYKGEQIATMWWTTWVHIVDSANCELWPKWNWLRMLLRKLGVPLLRKV